MNENFEIAISQLNLSWNIAHLMQKHHEQLTDVSFIISYLIMCHFVPLFL